MVNKSTATLFAAACLLMLSVGGCDSSSSDSTSAGSQGGNADSSAVSTLTGNIVIDGSSTVLPISNAAKEQFQKEFPEVRITVSGSGTGNGFKRFYSQETDISDASRPIKPGEFEKCKEAGIRFIELPIAYDGLTIVVHPKNDWVQQLTIDQLKKMFIGDNAPKTWKDVDPAWPDEEIKFFAPGTGSGTYDYFYEVIAKEDDKEIRSDLSLNEDDNILVQGVAGNKNSIGFFGVAYYEENKDKLRAVPIVSPEDGIAYEPTQENIATNQYAPFSRPLFIYVNAESLNKAQVQVFVDFLLENAPGIAESVDYVRSPEPVAAKARENFDAVKTGTYFINEAGESKNGSITKVFVEGTPVQ